MVFGNAARIADALRKKGPLEQYGAHAAPFFRMSSIAAANVSTSSSVV
jgi:hypothetical protein